MTRQMILLKNYVINIDKTWKKILNQTTKDLNWMMTVTNLS